MATGPLDPMPDIGIDWPDMGAPADVEPLAPVQDASQDAATQPAAGDQSAAQDDDAILPAEGTIDDQVAETHPALMVSDTSEQKYTVARSEEHTSELQSH